MKTDRIHYLHTAAGCISIEYAIYDHETCSWRGEVKGIRYEYWGEFGVMDQIQFFNYRVIEKV